MDNSEDLEKTLPLDSAIATNLIDIEESQNNFTGECQNDDAKSFTLSDLSGELDLIDNLHSPMHCSDGNIGAISDPSVDIHNESPTNKRFKSGFPRLSSTPYLRAACSRAQYETNVRTDTEEAPSSKNVLKRNLSYQNLNHTDGNHSKRFKTDHSFDLNENDEEFEIKEHRLVVFASVKFVINKTTNKIRCAKVTQLNLPNEINSENGISPSDAFVMKRLSNGFGSDSSGNLADRSYTASSGSVPSFVELPPTHKRANSQGENKDSFTSSSSFGLASISRHNGAHSLDVWLAQHLFNPVHNSIIKQMHEQQIPLSCSNCGYSLNNFEIHNSNEAVHSNATSESQCAKTDMIKSNHNVVTEDHKKVGKAKCDINMDEAQGNLETKTVLKKDQKVNPLLKDTIPVLENISHTKDKPCTSKSFDVQPFSPSSFDNSTSSLSDCDTVFNQLFSSPFVDSEDNFKLAVKGKAGPFNKSIQQRKADKVDENKENDNFRIIFEGHQLPYPKLESKLFKNCNFIFTSCYSNWVKDNENLKCFISSSTRLYFEDSSHSGDLNESVKQINPIYLSYYIRCGGGQVFKSLNQVHSSERSNTYLISSHPCRTINYLECLAAGISRYHQKSILECCFQGKPFKHKLPNFVQLPTGRSDETNRFINQQENSLPLNSCFVLLALKDSYHLSSETNFWKRILKKMGASVIVHNFNNDTSYHLNVIDIIVANPYCTESLIEEANRLCKPIVNCNWIINTLIHGSYRNPSSSKTYKYTYLPEN